MEETIIKNDSLDMAKAKKNYCLFLFEILACIFIVIIHTSFPGKLGPFLIYFARFGVPLFFMISGYYMISEEIKDPSLLRKRLAVKLLKLLLLLCISTIVHFCLDLYLCRNDLLNYFTTIFNGRRLLFYALFNLPFITVHNWFILALMYVYIIVICFPRLFMGKSVFIYIFGLISVVTIVLHILAYQSDLILFDEKISYLAYFRNWFFSALPLVSCGVIIRRNINRLKKINLYLIISLMIVAAIMMVIEIYLYDKFLNAKIEYCLFNIIFDSLILIFANKKPLYYLERFKLLSFKGNWTTFVYLFHPANITLFDEAYKKLGLNKYDFYLYLRPLLIVAISILIAVVFNHYYVIFENKYFKKVRA